MPIERDKDIFRFDISIHNISIVEILNAQQNL